MLAALVIGVVNFLIRPVLLLLTLPINILTLGLFTLVINAICLKLAASLIPGFDIEGFGSAFIGAIILALINMLFHALLMPGTSQQV